MVVWRDEEKESRMYRSEITNNSRRLMMMILWSSCVAERKRKILEVASDDLRYVFKDNCITFFFMLNIALCLVVDDYDSSFLHACDDIAMNLRLNHATKTTTTTTAPSSRMLLWLDGNSLCIDREICACLKHSSWEIIAIWLLLCI